MSSLTHAVRSCLLVLPLLAASARGDVIVVDEAGGGDFTHPGPAVAAALDGDIVLIRPGHYVGLDFPVDIDGKALSIIGDAGGTATIPFVSVRNMPAGGTVALRNLTLVANPLVSFLGATLAATSNAGVLFVEDCVIEGFVGSSANPGFDAVRIDSSAGAVFTRCTLLGGAGDDTAQPPFPTPVTLFSSVGGRAARVDGSPVAFYDCLLVGGRGGDDLLFDNGGSDGGPGVLALGARVTLSGTTVIGGPGGDGCDLAQSATACRGGSAVTLSGTNPLLEQLDSDLQGGAGGTLDGGGQAADGAPTVVLSGTTLQHPGQAVGMHKTAPVRTGETATLTVTGPEGHLFGVFFSFGAGFTPKLGFSGVFQLGFPFAGPILLFVMPPGDTFSVDYTAGEIASFGLEGYVTFDQVLMDQGPDGLVASSASSHWQVDTGF